MAIIVPIIADTSRLTRNVNGAGSSLKKFGKIAALAAGAAALGALVKTIEVGTKKFIAQDDAIKQTNARLKSTGGVANVTADSVVKLSNAIAGKTGVDDDQIHSAENMLLTFTHLRNEVGKNNNIFDQATQTTVDLSVAFKKDLQGSAILVGKALNDPVKGLSALGRVGVQFTEGQKKTIKALVETGDLMGAQKLILKELNTQVGGAAEAYGKTLPGQLSILKQAFDEIALGVAVKFIPTVLNAFHKLTGFIGELSKQPTFTAKVKFVLGSLGGIAWTGFETLHQWWTQSGRTELPARIILIPSGQQQFEALYQSMREGLNDVGRRLGRSLGGAIIDGFRSDSKKTGKGFIAAIQSLDEMLKKAMLGFGGELVADIVTGFLAGLNEIAVEKLGKGIKALIGDALLWAANGLRLPVEQVERLLRRLVLSPRLAEFSDSVKKNIATAIADAVQSARANLASLGASVGGMLGTLRASPLSKQSAAIRKQLKMEADARDKLRLEGAVASAETDDERVTAARDLDIFLRNLEAERLDDAATAAQDAAQSQVDDLIATFNAGGSLADLMAGLNALLSGVSGDSLGTAFALSWNNAVAGLLAQAPEIAAILGAAPLGPGAPVSPGAAGAEVATSERQRQYDEALRRWQTARDGLVSSLVTARGSRDARRKEAKKDDSPGGATITPAEQRAIDKLQDRVEVLVGNQTAQLARRPKKADFGLAMGGILKKQVFTAGEAGPEAVIPLNSSRGVGMLAAALGGGQGKAGATYNIVVNAGLGTNPDELSRIIVESIRRFEKRNGQVFSGPILSTTTNTSGKTDTGVGATDFSRITTLRSK